MLGQEGTVFNHFLPFFLSKTGINGHFRISP